jgi:hypothetical protein
LDGFDALAVAKRISPQKFEEKPKWVSPGGGVFQLALETAVIAPEDQIPVKGRPHIARRILESVALLPWVWHRRLLVEIATKSKVDAAAGTAITELQKAWYARVQEAGSVDASDAQAMEKVLRASLMGEMQILDGMDTLVAALNWVRLVQLNPVARNSWPKGLDLDAMLAGLGAQVDAELALLVHPDRTLGLGETLKAQQRLRIEFVADLIKRVREIRAEHRND